VSDPFSEKRIQAAYDAAAGDYQARFSEDLDQLPLDRRMLDLARRSVSGGVVLDLGCGTGSAASYISRSGTRAVGLDLSFGMLGSCRSFCELPLCQGDMRHLPFGDQAFAAVVAYYSIQHVRRSELGMVLSEAARVLNPGGTLLLSAHLGEGEVYIDEFLGHHIASTGGCLYSCQGLVEQMASSGFVVETTETRGPLDHEHQSQRLYLFARRT
jgi:ubiquinone/menaquinone biosynthesis C-methylase UbiE